MSNSFISYLLKKNRGNYQKEEKKEENVRKEK